ncbi:hypothetical protein ACEQPO_28195 [Bacillus sp. SL00103]
MPKKHDSGRSRDFRSNRQCHPHRDDELMAKIMSVGADQELALTLLDELKMGKLVICKDKRKGVLPRAERFFMSFHCDKWKS